LKSMLSWCKTPIVTRVAGLQKITLCGKTVVFGA
jgi:hypothetical protein